MAKTNDFSSNSTFNPTPHKLVIAEKPSVARSIANVLGASNKKKAALRATDISFHGASDILSLLPNRKPMTLNIL